MTVRRHAPDQPVGGEEKKIAATSPGLRDTNDFYTEGDPLKWVDHSLLDEIRKVCGRSLLDLGCGVGGYSRYLMDAGYDVLALDVNAAYVERARRLGVDARPYDGSTIPLADGAVDTVFMVEVLEHVPEPARILAEVSRVIRKNVVITVPNNTQRLNGLIAWSHMLDVDHKNFFTVDTLHDLLRTHFDSVDVRQVASADRDIARDLLSKWTHRMYRLAVRVGLEQDKLYFRLVATGDKRS